MVPCYSGSSIPDNTGSFIIPRGAAVANVTVIVVISRGVERGVVDEGNGAVQGFDGHEPYPPVVHRPDTRTHTHIYIYTK